MEVGGEARFSDSSLIMHQSEVVVVTLQADRKVSCRNIMLGSMGPYVLQRSSKVVRSFKVA